VIWLLLSAIVVMFMHVGFAMIETGFCRAKNALNTIAITLMVFPLSCLAFWVYGFAIGWGNSSQGALSPCWKAALALPDSALDRGVGFGPLTDDAGKATGGYAYGLAGAKGFFLSDIEPSRAGVSPATGSREDRVTEVGDARASAGLLALFFFFMALVGKAALIPTGAMLERWRWRNFCLYGLFIVLPFALAANWVWGGGWLARAGLNWRLGHGVVDYSGAGVIHALGGTIGLVGAWLIGPRTGKYRNGRAQPLPGHHVPMVVLGSLIVAFGWFALNAGFALSGSDIPLSGAIVNTALAAMAGTLASMLALGARKMKPDPTLVCNGMIAGLVAISGPCPFVDTWAAVVIGAAAGCVVVVSVLLLERRGIDDPAGAISVHGVAGLWGLLAVGIFANGRCGALWNGVQRGRFAVDGVRGLLYGDAGQLAAQALGAAVIVAFGLIVAWTWFHLANRCAPMRVSRDVELEGLDGPELGALAYPDFALTRHA
jgi:Amt family ammonium transporter